MIIIISHLLPSYPMPIPRRDLGISDRIAPAAAMLFQHSARLKFIGARSFLAGMIGCASRAVVLVGAWSGW